MLFIHCWAGRGRTGLIAACLLGKLYPEVGAEQALNRVDAYYRCRGTVAVGKTCRVSPETEEQEDQVRLFFEKVLKRQSSLNTENSVEANSLNTEQVLKR